MKTWKLLLGASLGMLASFATEASAQGYQTPRPTVSPYINLLRRGNSAVTYYGIVRPQFDQQQFNQQVVDQQAQLRQQIQAEQAQEAEGELGEGSLRTTGHPTQVLSYGRFFNNRGSGGMSVAPLAGGLGSAQRPAMQNIARQGTSARTAAPAIRSGR